MANHRLSPEAQDEVKRLLLSGMPIRECARVTGHGQNTVYRYFHELGIEATCGCGKPSNHRGWCSHRFLHSPTREKYQALLRMEPTGLCLCGCGGRTTQAKHDCTDGVKKGAFRRFLPNHHNIAIRKFDPHWGEQSQKVRGAHVRWKQTETGIFWTDLWANAEHVEGILREQRVFRHWRNQIVAKQERIYREEYTAHVLQRRADKWAMLTVIENERKTRKKMKLAAFRRAAAHNKNTISTFRNLALISALPA